MLSKIKNFDSWVRERFLALNDKFWSLGSSSVDTVVVFGFWRSGTTWLLELLAKTLSARTVFEPLNYKVPGSRAFIEELEGTSLGNHVVPYVSPEEDLSEKSNDFLRSVLIGNVSNSWTQRAACSEFLFSKTVIVKTIYGCLLAAYLQKHFDCRTVFILRHPCAVAASVLRNDWGTKWLVKGENIDLLLSQEKLTQDHLSKYERFIEENRGEEIKNLALLYSILNYVPLMQMRELGFHPEITRYEDLVVNPKKTFRELLVGLNYDSIDEKLENLPFRMNSATTQEARENTKPKDRIYSWREELGDGVISKILNITSKFDGLLDVVNGELS